VNPWNELDEKTVAVDTVEDKFKRTAASIWFEVWGGRESGRRNFSIPVEKISDFGAVHKVRNAIFDQF